MMFVVANRFQVNHGYEDMFEERVASAPIWSRARQACSSRSYIGLSGMDGMPASPTGKVEHTIKPGCTPRRLIPNPAEQYTLMRSAAPHEHW